MTRRSAALDLSPWNAARVLRLVASWAAVAAVAGCGGAGGASLPSASSALQAASGLAGGAGGPASAAASAAQPAMSALGSAASSALPGLAGSLAGTKTVQVQVTASADSNASAAGQGAPVIVRIYQLGAASTFEGAEFYRLFNADAATLGADLIRKDEVLVAPGATRTQSLDVSDKVRAIGVFAAFRTFSGKVWRVTLPVPDKSGATVSVAVSNAGLAAGR